VAVIVVAIIINTVIIVVFVAAINVTSCPARAQAVSRLARTAEAKVESQTSSCAILVQLFSQYFGLPWQHYFTSASYSSLYH
jgi:ABC-type maltose transport system permease subunit